MFAAKPDITIRRTTLRIAPEPAIGAQAEACDPMRSQLATGFLSQAQPPLPAKLGDAILEARLRITPGAAILRYLHPKRSFRRSQT
jgi:hypothetical protein